MANNDRTVDVRVFGKDGDLTFMDLPISEPVVEGLRNAGCVYPSPIQLKALPLALFGSDLVAQSKSGTGKTLVFSITSIEYILGTRASSSTTCSRPKVLILAPTREIAVQIRDVTRQLARHVTPQVKCHAFIGGFSIQEDKNTLDQGYDIAVGTPGRIRALVDQQLMQAKLFRMLILDEVDKLMKKDFSNEIEAITAALPERKQVLVFSATFTSSVFDHVFDIMRFPQYIRTCGQNDSRAEIVSEDELKSRTSEHEPEPSPELWLHGVDQFYCIVDQSSPLEAKIEKDCSIRLKVMCLAKLLSEITFQQCIVFCNDKPRALALSSVLDSMGWRSSCITGSQPQQQRLDALARFRDCKVRVLLSTDLTARGIDIDTVNLVINLDLPRDPATYLHRVGRTGRYGSYGTAITLITAAEMDVMTSLAELFNMAIGEYQWEQSYADTDEVTYVEGNTHRESNIDEGQVRQWEREEKMFAEWRQLYQ